MLVVGSDASLPAPLRNEEASTVCIQQGPSRLVRRREVREWID